MKDLIITTYHPDNLMISLPHVLRRKEIDNFRITISCDNPNSSILGLQEVYPDILVIDTEINRGMFMHRLFLIDLIRSMYSDSESIMFLDDDDVLLKYPDKKSNAWIDLYHEYVVDKVHYLINPDLIGPNYRSSLRQGISGAVLDSNKSFEFVESLRPFIQSALRNAFGTEVVNSAEDTLLRFLANQYFIKKRQEVATENDEVTMLFNRVRTRVDRYRSDINDPMYQVNDSMKERNFLITKIVAEYKRYLDTNI